MYLFATFIRSGLFAEGRFLGRVFDEWIDDLQEFIHTKLPHLIVILVIAIVLSRLITLAAHRMSATADRKDSTPGRHSQVKTFANVIRTTLHAILWSLTAIEALTIIGVNLGPLLASAGVAGIAIGLAAQTIVKDLLNGALIVLEDQFNVGETVRLTGMTGVVVAMTLRRTEVRDGDGTLYVIPNSQITTVANLSRDYSVATVNVAVDFSATPDKVIPLLTSVAMGVRNDPAFAPLFLQDSEVLGVDSINGSQVIYPVTFRTLATKQYGPIREFRRRVRNALEENGILPGDPYRTFREFQSTENPNQLAETSTAPQSSQTQGKPNVDPTTIKAETHDPFTATS